MSGHLPIYCRLDLLILLQPLFGPPALTACLLQADPITQSLFPAPAALHIFPHRLNLGRRNSTSDQ